MDSEGSHTFVTAPGFKVNKFGWGNNTCDILDISSDKYNPNKKEIHKYLLDCDRGFNLLFLSEFVSPYITLDSRVAQDDAMLYDFVISSLSSEGLVKVSD